MIFPDMPSAIDQNSIFRNLDVHYLINRSLMAILRFVLSQKNKMFGPWIQISDFFFQFE